MTNVLLNKNGYMSRIMKVLPFILVMTYMMSCTLDS